MWDAQCYFVLLNIGMAAGLSCFNCSSTQQDWTRCAGDFSTVPLPFNSTKLRLINCTGGLSACADNAMCFVRSWAARAKHAWLVQRGCYHASREDPLPRTLYIPMRSMSCKLESKITNLATNLRPGCVDGGLLATTVYDHNIVMCTRIANLFSTRSSLLPLLRLGDAEYKVCLCQADWCNSAKSNDYHETQLKLTKSIVAVLAYYIPYLYML